MGTLIGSKLLNLKAFQTNGADERAYINNPSFKTDTQGAFAFWYKPTTVLSATALKPSVSYGVRDVGNDSLLQFVQRWNANPGILAPYNSQTIPEVLARKTNGGTNNAAYGNHIFVAGAWVLWVVQSNGTAWTHYINGSSVGSTAWSGTNTGDWLGDVSGSDHRLAFGCRFRSNVADYFDDACFNEGIYVQRPLTSGEITKLYNGGTPINPRRANLGSDLISHWRFGDSRDDATTIYDEIGSNNLTLVNADASNYVTT